MNFIIKRDRVIVDGQSYPVCSTKPFLASFVHNGQQITLYRVERLKLMAGVKPKCLRTICEPPMLLPDDLFPLRYCGGSLPSKSVR
jgi:hypothetical protein